MFGLRQMLVNLYFMMQAKQKSIIRHKAFLSLRFI